MKLLKKINKTKIFSGRFKVSLQDTGGTDSDPYGSKNNIAGLPNIPAC